MLQTACIPDHSLTLRPIDMGRYASTLLSSCTIRQVMAFRLPVGSDSGLLQVRTMPRNDLGECLLVQVQNVIGTVLKN